MCGHENGIASQNHCGKRLLLVEYLGVDENTDADVPVCECGGSNSYYQGFCLCSPVGCDVFNTQKCYPNPLHWFDNGYIEANGNIGIIAEEYVLGYEPGRVWTVDQQVHVVAAPYRQRDLHATRESVRDFDQPVLWHRGRRGGPARVVMWMNCGGHSLGYRSWFGDKILPDRPWLTQEEDCTHTLLTLLTHLTYSLTLLTHLTSLAYSLTLLTHARRHGVAVGGGRKHGPGPVFRDAHIPAGPHQGPGVGDASDQVCHSLAYSLTYSLTHLLTHSPTYSLTYSLTHLPSRAHRMGAAGPVQVHLVQVHETEDIKEV